MATYLIRQGSTGHMRTAQAKSELGALRKLRESLGEALFGDDYDVKERGAGSWTSFRITPGGNIKFL